MTVRPERVYYTIPCWLLENIGGNTILSMNSFIKKLNVIQNKNMKVQSCIQRKIKVHLSSTQIPSCILSEVITYF